MRLVQLIAHNFRLLENFEIGFESDVTVLIGANNAGKSNVIDALLIFQEASALIIREVLNARGGFERVVSRHDIGKTIALSALFLDGETKIQWTIHVSNIGLVDEKLQHGDKLWTLTRREDGVTTYTGPDIGDSRVRVANEQIRLGNYWQQHLPPEFWDYVRSIIHIDPFRHVDTQAGIAPQEALHPSGQDLARVIHYHYNNDRERFDRYEELVRSVIPDIRLIETPIIGGPAATIAIRFADDRLAYNLQQLSSGLKDVLILVGAVHFAPRGSLIIIEEPENHLHPAAQKALAAVFKRTAAAEEKQILLTTHSESIAAQFDPGAVLFVDRQRTAERVVPLAKADVYTVAQQLGIEQGKFLQLLGRTRQVAVIVEGRNDYDALDPLWRHFEISDKVVPVRALGGGWQEIIETAANLRDALVRFRLPSGVFVLLDSDRERDAKVAALREKGLTEETSHVWIEEELESYLLCPTALSRISGKTVENVNQVIAQSSGRGKGRYERVTKALGVDKLPKNILVQNALANAPGELSPEFMGVAQKVRRMLGLPV